MSKYTLVGVDGNAFAIIGYTQKALKHAGLFDKVSEMREKAMSGDYSNVITTCDEYLDMANEALELDDDD